MVPAARRWLAALAAASLLGAAPATAGAHPMAPRRSSLDIESGKVGGELELPLDRLAVALQRPLTAAQATGPLRAQLARYARAHIRAVGADGRAWTVAVGAGHIERVAGHDDLVMPLSLTPPDGRVTDFGLHYDVIIEQLVTHKAIATIRSQWHKGTSARNPETLGVFDWNTRTLRVDADGGSWLRGFTATAGLGVQHIATGADHLLFLLMLLIPAPLVARRGRWRRGDDARRSALRVVHVVTAFAIGHSTTLALATLGLVHLPSRLVESLIAVSILVSAVHALRPLVPGGEAWIAAGFGLVRRPRVRDAARRPRAQRRRAGLLAARLQPRHRGHAAARRRADDAVAVRPQPDRRVRRRPRVDGAGRDRALGGVAARADVAPRQRPVRTADERARGAPARGVGRVRAAGARRALRRATSATPAGARA